MLDQLNMSAASTELPRPGWRTTLVPAMLALLVGHFALVQLLAGAQFGDAPRNLHWGLLTWEQPGFLLGQPDRYERIKGFEPDPPGLAQRGLWADPQSGLHPWWGPVTPLLFAGIWGLFRSYTLLQLVIPAAAGAAVLLVYAAGRRMLGGGPALIAAAFLSGYPLFREYGTSAYNEALGALILTAALFAYLGGRTTAAVLCGTLAGLTKMDLFALYLGTVGVTLLFDRFAGQRELPWRHHLFALLGPLLLAAPWVWLHYLDGGERGPTAPLSPDLFTIIFPMMLELTFYIPWYGALLVLGAIAAAVVAGLPARTLPPLVAVALATWLGLTLLVTLVYCPPGVELLLARDRPPARRA